MHEREQEQRKVGFIFPVSLIERLEEAKWLLRKNKGEIVIEALEEFLSNYVEGSRVEPVYPGDPDYDYIKSAQDKPLEEFPYAEVKERIARAKGTAVKH